MGSDRVLQLTFGYGNHTALLFLEFYAGGNIVLTDERLTILSLLRPYTSPDGVAVRVRSTYPVTSSGAPGRMEATRFRDVLASVVASAVAVRAEAGPGGPNSKVRRKMQVCRLLADAACYGPQLVEHALLSAGANLPPPPPFPSSTVLGRLDQRRDRMHRALFEGVGLAGQGGG